MEMRIGGFGRVIGIRKIWVFTQKMMCRLVARMRRQARGSAVAMFAAFDGWCTFGVLCGKVKILSLIFILR